MAGGERLYVYGLAAPGLPKRLRILGRPLRTLSIDGIDVVVEPEDAGRVLTTEALEAQHAVVVKLAARAPALLPARFGSLSDEAALRRVVAAHRREILRALAHVRNRDQMTIRVFGTPEAPAAPGPASSGAEFLRRRREQARYEPPEVADIRRVLAPYVAGERVVPGERTLRVTVFHLVARRRRSTYLSRASTLQQILAPHRVTVTGPWPPFAFAPELF